MINFLTDPLPSSLCIGGEKYEINTDFKTWIKIEEIFSESQISSADKIIRIFSLAFVSRSLPPSIDETIRSVAEFLFPSLSSRGKGSGGGGAPSFSFSCDGGLIYAAFLSQYGIDLASARLHWWRFLALFYALDSCKFTEIVKIRTADLSLIKDPNQKRFIRKMKRLYRLPNGTSDMSSEIGKIF